MLADLFSVLVSELNAWDLDHPGSSLLRYARRFFNLLSLFLLGLRLLYLIHVFIEGF